MGALSLCRDCVVSEIKREKKRAPIEVSNRAEREKRRYAKE